MKLIELEPRQQQHVLNKIKELQASDGWSFLKEIMAHEREEFFKKIANPQANTHPDVINYNRGIIQASYSLADMPEKVISQLEGALQLFMATQNANAPLPQNTTP